MHEASLVADLIRKIIAIAADHEAVGITILYSWVDEAHRLRNVYRKDNKIAKTILEAIGNRSKVLLTATPLQNSLMELYGLVSFIDPHLFGGQESFGATCAPGAQRQFQHRAVFTLST